MAKRRTTITKPKKTSLAGEPAIWEASELIAFRKRLRQWFRKHARDLPWRQTQDPYAVWISEIMLQQTQVATVIPYYERFIARFPTVTMLAQATEQDVLRLWEGLGYYRRARQLHRAAQTIVEQFQGEFPTTHSQVLSLPGIGRYTAGAILSIALNQAHPILEGNTVRLHARLLNYDGDPQSSEGQRLLWSFAEHLITRHQPGELNQALMELGSLVCSPTQPACLKCPVASHCRSLRAGQVELLPRTKKTMQYEDRHEVAVVIVQDGHYLMRKCQTEDRWAGLWDFVRFDAPRDLNSSVSKSRRKMAMELQSLDEKAREQTGLEVRTVEHLLQLKHAVTRFRIRLDCFRAEISGGNARLQCGSQPDVKQHEENPRDLKQHDLKQHDLKQHDSKQHDSKQRNVRRLGDRQQSDTQHRVRQRRVRQRRHSMPAPNTAAWAWIPADELDKLPLSVTGRKLSDYLKANHR